MKRYKISWIITAEDNQKLIRDFLLENAGFSNRLLIKAKQEDGDILINGVKKTVRYMLQESDKLEVVFPPEEVSAYLEKEPMTLDIVYEDKDLLIVNKPAGIPTLPSRLHTTGTLANGVLYYYEQQHIPFTIHVVTRLDRDTSGLVLFAKHQYSHSLFSKLQRNQQIQRVYIAYVHGYLDKKYGTIDAPIGRHPDSIIERKVTPEGQTAITHYQVIEERTNFSKLQIQLETGRTHQIRVHFAHIHQPLLGDELYGGRKDIIERQALHCAEISFIHPFSQQKILVQADLPDDMNQVSISV